MMSTVELLGPLERKRSPHKTFGKRHFSPVEMATFDGDNDRRGFRRKIEFQKCTDRCKNKENVRVLGTGSEERRTRAPLQTIADCQVGLGSRCYEPATGRASQPKVSEPLLHPFFNFKIFQFVVQLIETTQPFETLGTTK